MPRDARAFLWDVRQAADNIAAFIRGKTEQAYANDELLHSAVERQLEIIGEALNQLSTPASDLQHPAVFQIARRQMSGDQCMPRRVSCRSLPLDARVPCFVDFASFGFRQHLDAPRLARDSHRYGD